MKNLPTLRNDCSFAVQFSISVSTTRAILLFKIKIKLIEMFELNESGQRSAWRMVGSVSALSLFSFFWHLFHRMRVNIHWKVFGEVFSTLGSTLAATQRPFLYKSSMHALSSMSAILCPFLVAKDILLQESTTTQTRIVAFTKFA